MSDDQDWLSDIVVVNENTAEDTAGDVDIFRNAAVACASLEPWWVDRGDGFVRTANGARVILKSRGPKVMVDRIEPSVEGQELVLAWLLETAAAVLRARRTRAAKGKAVLGPLEAKGVLPTTLEGLIAYIGFSE